MKKSVRFLLTLSALVGLALGLQAQPALKVMVVDMAKVYDNHYKTEEQNIKLKGDMQKAQVELDRINKEGSELIEQYKEALEMSKNPALTNEARAKAENETRMRLEAVQKKGAERDNLTQTVEQSRDEQVKKFRDYLLAEISRIASDIAKKKGATLLLDKAGPTLFGVSNLTYFDPAYDITDEVMKEVNKDRPVTTTPASTGAAAAPAAVTPAKDAAPAITMPGVAGKK